MGCTPLDVLDWSLRNYSRRFFIASSSGLRKDEGILSNQFRLQTLDLFLDERGHPVPGEVNLAHVDAQRRGDLLDGPFLDHVEIENLVLFRFDLAFDPPDGDAQNVALPFFVPDGVQIEAARVRDFFNRGGSSRRGAGAR